MTDYTRDRIVVFAGPSLAGVVLAAPFVRLAPAGAGDMLRLAATPPCTVVLIDGVFDFRPAVWHKEILLLLSRGFRVIGGASMGALRAAELHGFGMIGVGRIFAAYADGRITGDDEVAVIHAPPELGSAPLSLAQVDVRATLVAAVRAGVVAGDQARQIRALSAAIFYQDRTWAVVCRAAAAAGLTTERFTLWLNDGAVEQKAIDARTALDAAARLADRPAPEWPAPPRTWFLDRLADAVAVHL